MLAASLAGVLESARWADLRGAHGLGHAIKLNQALAATAGRKTFIGLTIAGSGILPIVGDPDVAGRVDGGVNEHLHTTAFVATGRGNGVAGFHARRARLRPCTTQFSEPSSRRKV